MSTRPTRREVLRLAAVSGFGLSSLGRLALAQPGPRSFSLVDGHVHVFNAADLPINGFLNLVLARGGLGRFGRRFGGILDLGLSARAPGFQEEKARLDTLLKGRGSDDWDAPFSLGLADAAAAGAATDDQLAAALPAGESLGSGFEGLGGWLKLLGLYRYQIAKVFWDLHGDLDLQLFVPATVDLGGWLDDCARTTVWQQVELYGRIVRLFSGRMHPFVGFDPCRQSWDTAALVEVKRAVESRGFLGVKLYNPMGFKPVGNSDPRIEAALEELYSWCAAEQVPLLAHGRRSNGAGLGAAKKARPELWAEVLRNQPDLRLSFGHFGGAGRLAKRRESSWAWFMGQLMDTYEGVYADSGLHPFALGTGNEAEARAFFRSLAALFEAHPGVRDKFLYGSDWQMSVRSKGNGRFAHNYRHLYSRFLVDEGSEPEEQVDRFMAGNALAFLGLDEPHSKPWRRLVAFYESSPGDFRDPPAWWPEQLDLDARDPDPDP